MKKNIDIIDIHAHIIYGADDGPKTPEESLLMLRRAHSEGIRRIIATPHSYSKLNFEELNFRLEYLREKLKEEKLDMELFLGQEIYYSSDIGSELQKGNFFTLNFSKYVLIEFNRGVGFLEIVKAVRDIVYVGYSPILAHVERYFCLRKEGALKELVSCGAYLQMNYSCILGGLFNSDVRWCKKQIMSKRIHFLSTDMHNTTTRDPSIKKSLKWLEKALDEEYFIDLVQNNARKVLENAIL
jgi:hypothetical protein